MNSRCASSSRVSQTRRAFTLIELLVVIAIIAILASLLLPGLRRAKQQAQGIVCLGNLKQFSLAWLQYADDHDERVPPNEASLDANHRGTNTWVQGWLDPDNIPYWGDNVNTDYLTESLIAPYLGRSVAIWRCPGDRSRSRFSYDESHMLPRVRSYSMSSGFDSTPDNHRDGKIWPRKLSELTSSPSRTFVFIDERQDSIQDCYFPVDMLNGPASLLALPSPYHNGAGTVSFADGHAELRKWRDRRTTPPMLTRGFAGIMGSFWPTNSDVIWLQERTAQWK
ncbi:MAG: type II secretion system protein [Verrucomicrobia bacterium]|nr:type II secretion system protein [Verrucomicrobiota bacterium]